MLLLPLYLPAPIVVWGAIVLLEQSWFQIGVILEVESLLSLFYGMGIAIVGLCLVLTLKWIFRLVALRNSEDVSLASAGKTTRIQESLAILGFLALGLWIGGIEELVFRGWIQTQLEISFDGWLAACIGSAIFAAAHLIWDGRPGLWQQPGLWVLGWVLVVARWADGGNLSLAWGLHAGWVGGLAYIDAFLPPQTVEYSPQWLTGRPNQPLTGGLDFLLMGITAGLVWWTNGGLP
ncbi:MAG: lysostaphin resistance A-like protein [Leptolyngbyaceae cyanobacterium]